MGHFRPLYAFMNCLSPRWGCRTALGIWYLSHACRMLTTHFPPRIAQSECTPAVKVQYPFTFSCFGHSWILVKYFSIHSLVRISLQACFGKLSFMRRVGVGDSLTRRLTSVPCHVTTDHAHCSRGYFWTSRPHLLLRT
jgi:hypothetical protein